MAAAASAGIGLETIASEYDVPQFEVTIEHKAPLEAVDNTFFLKLLCREIASRHGLLLSGYWANWGYDHRAVAVRVPSDRGSGTRLENRLPDGASNPYVATAETASPGSGRRPRITPRGVPHSGYSQ